MYKHKKSGNLYSKTGIAIAQAAKPIHDMDKVVVYKNAKDELFIRPVEEFNDGRYQCVPGEEHPHEEVTEKAHPVLIAIIAFLACWLVYSIITTTVTKTERRAYQIGLDQGLNHNRDYKDEQYSKFVDSMKAEYLDNLAKIDSLVDE